jgi:GrpB-like predicted nucleotidyltransferase (UPF0157 family)
MLGLKHNVNVLVDYDERWPSEFEAEQTRIVGVLGCIAKGIEHYGSTAVVGMRAKPIIDILVGVEPFDDWAKCREPLERIVYDYAPNAGVPGHHIFGRGRDKTERTHLLHVVEFNGPSWRVCLAIRDALRADPTLQAAYAAVKEQAVADAPEGRARYNQLKQPFLDALKGRL